MAAEPFVARTKHCPSRANAHTSPSSIKLSVSPSEVMAVGAVLSSQEYGWMSLSPGKKPITPGEIDGRQRTAALEKKNMFAITQDRQFIRRGRAGDGCRTDSQIPGLETAHAKRVDFLRAPFPRAAINHGVPVAGKSRRTHFSFAKRHHRVGNIHRLRSGEKERRAQCDGQHGGSQPRQCFPDGGSRRNSLGSRPCLCRSLADPFQLQPNVPHGLKT